MVATATQTVATPDLAPGMYFKDRATWYRCAGQPTVGSLTDTWVARVMTRQGLEVGMVLYTARVETLPPGAVPSTWAPAALRREARKSRWKAERLLAMAEAAEELADAQEISQAK